MPRSLRVLIACEFSGRVRDAFRARGHDAWSCDLRATGHPHHYQADALEVSRWRNAWDLMIAHPPCTYMANSGVRWLFKDGEKDRQRFRDMRAGAAFFKQLLNAPIPRVAVENPIVHGHALKAIGRLCDQVIHPWQFGDGESKATCLWLRGLPFLIPTKYVEGREPRVHRTGGRDKAMLRSVTPKGIARAMAKQWGG